MAYSDLIRAVSGWGANDIANLIDGVFGSSGALGASSAWTPSFTGFSANPASPVGQYWQIGKLVIAMLRLPSTGTSNATSFTISAPVAARTLAGALWGCAAWDATDNGAYTADVKISIASAASTFTILKGGSTTGWTASGAKAVNFCAWYESP